MRIIPTQFIIILTITIRNVENINSCGRKTRVNAVLETEERKTYLDNKRHANF